MAGMEAAVLLLFIHSADTECPLHARHYSRCQGSVVNQGQGRGAVYSVQPTQRLGSAENFKTIMKPTLC